MKIRLAIIWIWKVIDPIFYIFSRLHYTDNNQSIFRVRLTKYKGKNFILSDGTNINKNDILLKIHLHNVRLLDEFIRIRNDLKRARMMYKLVLGSMPSLAAYLKEHPHEERIKGVIGITTLYKAVRPLGFESNSPSNRLYIYIKKAGQLPIFLLSSISFRDYRKNQLCYLFMSKEMLYKKYCHKPAN